MTPIPRVQHPAGFRGPDWITVSRVLTNVPDHAPVTRHTFAQAGCLRDWDWAVREREEGQVDGRRRDSPWLEFVHGQALKDVREALPIWCMCVGVIPVTAAAVLQAARANPSPQQAYWQDAYRGLVRDPMYLRRQEERVAILASPTATIGKLESTLARRHVP